MTSTWDAPGTVAGFVQSAPNEVLLRFAARERQRPGAAWVLDIGCGAGRNAIPLAESGWNVVGLDQSWPMLTAAAARARGAAVEGRLDLVRGAMDALPVRARCFDLVVAHGIWNLARSAAEFRASLRAASGAARPGAGLFVFTFSRDTLPAEVRPVPGESFVFTQFSGEPQCFLTAAQLVSELAAVGFAPDPTVPLTEYNRPAPGGLRARSVPVIYEAAFRYRG